MNLDNFLGVVPKSGYHAHNEEVDVFSEKDLSYDCGCGASHKVKDSKALFDTGISNQAVYQCPKNEKVLNFLKATGLIRIKGLKNIASLECASVQELENAIRQINLRKKIN